MPLTATRTTLTRIGPETTPGVAVPVTRQLQSLSLIAGIETKIENYQPSGYKYGTLAVPVQEWSSCKVDGIGDYAGIIYPMSGLFGPVTPTTSTAGVLSKEWLWNPSSTAVEIGKTFTVEQGSSVRTGQISNGAFTEYGHSFMRDAIVKATGAMIGQRYVDGFTPTAGPSEQQSLVATGATAGTFTLTFLGQTTAPIAFGATAAQVASALTALSTIGAGGVTATGGPLPTTAVVITFAAGLASVKQALLLANSTGLTGGAAVVTETAVGGFDVLAQPMSGNQVTIYADQTVANIGTTAHVAPLEAMWKITNKNVPVWVLNAANASYAQLIEGDPKVTLDLTLPADATGMSYLTNARAGSTIFLRFRTVGGLIEGALNYEHRADFAARVVKIANFADSKGFHAIKYSMEAFHDYSWGQSMSFMVRNTLTAL